MLGTVFAGQDVGVKQAGGVGLWQILLQKWAIRGAMYLTRFLEAVRCHLLHFGAVALTQWP
jgi:hypothetical protein